MSLISIGNHLWQSTLFAAAAWLLTLALRRNCASVRHWIWMAASVKFLVPFAAIVGLGTWLAPPPRPSLAAANTVALIESVGQPFVFSDAPAPKAPVLWAQFLLATWGFGSLGLAVLWSVRWARVRRSVRRASPMPAIRGVRVVSSWDFAAPGVFAILRPVLVLPQGIVERLSDDQLCSIVSHEICHVRRRDNLAALVQTAVETLFWFHPAVWWIGARLMEERERACDEEVVTLGVDRESYAEGILCACRFALEAAPACVSGVSGGNLTKRIEEIMAGGAASRLSQARKLLLSAAAAASFAGPVAYGVLNAPVLRAQAKTDVPAPKIEVVTIKPSKPGQRGYAFIPEPGGRLRTGNTSLRHLLLTAYHLHEVQLAGGPDWMDHDAWDIDAKAEGHANLNEDQLRALLAVLIEERFQLKTHRETKQMSVYSLVPAKGGPKMAKSDKEEGPGIRNRRIIDAKGGTMSQLADVLGWVMGRPVLDRTSLTGIYVYHLEWTPDESQIQAELAPTNPPAELDPNGQSIFVAIQDQLGLKLEASKGPVEVLVVDHAEKPKEN